MTFLLASLCKNPLATTAFSSSRYFARRSLHSTSLRVASSSSQQETQQQAKLIHLHSIPKEELDQVIVSWGFPQYRSDQVWNWVHQQGVTNVEEMTNVPKTLRASLKEFTNFSSLTLDTELVSKDGTIKRAYRLHDGQLIESVLMPYEDGRYTACISSQAGCAMGCVFCATGQGGFARQLSSAEIFEQVSKFASELARKDQRLSNIVFMGLGEPLANYRSVKHAVNRITNDLGIGARKITISTVGVVPNIRKLMQDSEMPQVRLAVSLHCASDEERTALIPANARYGGLEELMTTLKEYIDTTGRRLTLEWALIEGQNDTPQTARRLGQLIKTYQLRRDMVHVNVIPLNPTGGFPQGSPSGRQRVNDFINILEKEFGISTTPRVRRGIDIDAGCGQLKTKIEDKEKSKRKNEESDNASSVEKDLQAFLDEAKLPMVGVYEAEEYDVDNDATISMSSPSSKRIVDFTVDEAAVEFESDDFEDPVFDDGDIEQQQEAARLISLVQDSFPSPPIVGKTTSITNDDAIRESKRRRKKLLKNLKAIRKLREMQEGGRVLNEEQLAKVAREDEWKEELESVQHNLQ